MTVRQEKVQEQVLVQEISKLIQREVRDPRVGFVTLTGAEISRDLRHAKVFVSVLGDEEARKQSLKALNSASGIAAGRVRTSGASAHRAGIRLPLRCRHRARARIFELLHSVEGD